MNLSFHTENVNYAFGKFDRVTIEGTPYRVGPRNEEGYVLSVDDETGRARLFSQGQLSRLGAAGRIHVERNYFCPEVAQRRRIQTTVLSSSVGTKLRSRIAKRDAYCEAFLELEREKKVKRTDESIQSNMSLIQGTAIAYIEDLSRHGGPYVDVSADFGKPPSARSLRRWLSQKAWGGVVGLADAVAKRGNRTKLMSPETLGIMMAIVRKFLAEKQPKIKHIHENIQIAIRDRNVKREEEGLCPLEIPCRETVRRAVREIDPFAFEVARKGDAAARKKFRPVLNGLDVTRPLQEVQIDEWDVDVMTFMESTGIYGMLTDEEKLALGLDGKKKRWKLTVAICCTTRCILAMVISRTANGEAATQALQMIITNKGKWADAVGAMSSWDIFGMPEKIVTDGGPAFKSERYRFACVDLGIVSEIAINGVPELRGTIESVFKTFAMDLMPRLSGRTFSSIIEKGDADPEKRTALTLDDLTFALVRWVVDIYHNTPHRGLGGETPLHCWRRLSKKYGVQAPPDMHHARLVFGQRMERRLDKTGITVLGVRYQSEALATWMRHEDPGMVEVRWHPKDIGAVSVRMGQGWHDIPSLDSTLEGVAAQTWMTAVRHVSAATPKSNRIDLLAVREAIKAIEARNAAAMAAAGLNLEDWSDGALEKAEKRLLAGVQFFERKQPKAISGELGQQIPDLDDLPDAEEAWGEPAADHDVHAEPKRGQPRRKPTLNIEEE